MIEVAAAIIQRNGKILLARKASHKSNAGLWEFPGGKREQGESILACAKREIHEELGMDIQPIAVIAENTVKTAKGGLLLIGVFASTNQDPQQLLDHDQYQWCAPERILDLPLVPADRPLVAKTLAYLKASSQPQS